MKFTTSIAALIAAFAAGSGSAAAIGDETMSLNVARAEGGFAGSCRDIKLVRIRRPLHDMWELHGICPDPNDFEYKTTINLNLCLSNNKGVLNWAKRYVFPSHFLSMDFTDICITSGQFQQSCKGCDITKINKKDVNLKCICLPAADRGHVWAEIDLS